jgi:hypothetical protein
MEHALFQPQSAVAPDVFPQLGRRLFNRSANFTEACAARQRSKKCGSGLDGDSIFDIVKLIMSFFFDHAALVNTPMLAAVRCRS